MPISVKKLEKIAKTKEALNTKQRILNVFGNGKAYTPKEINKKCNTRSATSYLSRAVKEGKLKKISIKNVPYYYLATAKKIKYRK